MVQYNVMVFCVCVRVPAGGQCDGPSQHVGGRGQCSVPRRGVHQGGALQEEVPPLHPPALRTPSPPTPRRRRTPSPGSGPRTSSKTRAHARASLYIHTFMHKGTYAYKIQG